MPLAGPDEGGSLVGLDQAAEDRCREAGIVELDREVGIALLAGCRPRRAYLRVAGEDAEVW